MADKDNGALVKKNEHALVTADFGEYAGLGFEGTTSDELQIPFLVLLQDLSPQVKGTTKLEGAKPGMFFNTVTQELFDPAKDQLIFIPAMKDHCYMEWIPRKKGGGLVGRREISDPIVRTAIQRSTEFGKYSSPDGNDLVETFYVYGVLVANDTPQPICIAFTSMKIKAWKKYFTQMNYDLVQAPDGRKIKPPMFCHRCFVGSCDDRSRSGDEFKNITLTPVKGSVAESRVLDVNDPLSQSAASLAIAFRDGRASVDYAAQETSSGGDDDRDPTGVFDDDIM